MYEKCIKKINDDNKHNETRKYDKIKYTTQLEITTKNNEKSLTTYATGYLISGL